MFPIFSVMLAAAGFRPVQAESGVNGTVYSICYFGVAAPEVAAAARLTRAFATASGKEPGNIRFAAFQEIGRPSRFAIFEAWHDKTAAGAHQAAAATAAWSDKLAPMLVGPFEIRSFGGFSLAAASADGDTRAVYVLTHVDVFPRGKDEAAALVTTHAEAGRKMPGNLRFDVLQVDGHANHFTLVEGWLDRAALEASLSAAPTREFRRRLTPLEGALYDERLYHELR